MENALHFRTPFKGNKDWKLDYDGRWAAVIMLRYYLYSIMILRIVVQLRSCVGKLDYDGGWAAANLNF